MSDPIWAISLWQPWASLPFSTGRFGFIKKHETRHWPYPSRLDGFRILIHAAKNTSEMKSLPLYWREACADYPLGAFVGSVVLSGCYRTEDWESDPDDEAAGNWAPGRYAWKLTDPVALSKPIPAVGRQGFWKAPANLLDAA